MVLAGMATALATISARDAGACGAFYPRPTTTESTVVSDHRMALALSRQRTILWDQIQYTGNPKDFAYVLPVKPGTRVEPSSDAWFGALDASTRPLIRSPETYEHADDEGGGGCCAIPTTGGALPAGNASRGPDDNVQVLDEAVVGPYETVTVRSTDADALERWLVEHDYPIPPDSSPVIASYVRNGFDFIAFRMRPSQSERQIEPIRIVSPGPDPNLLLRVMKIGAGAKMGITLWVIGEGRYHGANFPDGNVDFSRLVWDYGQNRSNYQKLAEAAMSAAGGRSFITEYANRPNLSLSTWGATSANPGLGDAYKQSCKIVTAQGNDAGMDGNGDAGAADADSPASDASASDAGDAGDAETGEAVEDAGSGETEGNTSKTPKVHESKCDDLEVALDGLAQGHVWVTRLRGNIPNAALDDTLTLEPTPEQEPVSNVHATYSSGNVATASVSPGRVRSRHGTYLLVGLTTFVVSRIMRRKKSA